MREELKDGPKIKAQAAVWKLQCETDGAKRRRREGARNPERQGN